MSKKNKSFRYKDNGFYTNVYVQDETFFDYLERIKEIAISMFEWVNLPSSMDSFYLEMCLYYQGKAALLYDEKYGFINTKCATSSYLNIYGKPTKVNCYSFSYQEEKEVYYGFKEENEMSKCILVYNSINRQPTISSILLFAYRLYQAQATIDVNLNAQKTPVVVLTDEKQILSLKTAYQQFEGNMPVIFGRKDTSLLENFKVLKTDAPFITEKVQEYKKEIFNELLTYLGIKNLQTNKKERLVTSEADSNDELTNYYLQNKLAVRKEACKQFNEYFNLTDSKKIDVKIRSDLHNVIKELESVVNDYNLDESGEQFE